MCLYANTRPVKFFRFSSTPDNPVDHLYEFSFNGETGAEFSGNEVILHFVDGKRGDSNLTANGIIVDPGTIRTARSRISGEYLVALFMTPSSQEMESPVKPGRFAVPVP